MALPVIVPVAVIAVAAGAATVARLLQGRRVAILGAPGVGKTTLLQFLQHRLLPTSTDATTAPGPGESFALDVQGKSAKFVARNDLPGSDGLALPSWKKAVESADDVWYLFRADLVARGDADEIDRVRGHLGWIQQWTAGKKKPPRVVLVGTWSDQDPSFAQDAAAFARRVASTSPLDVEAAKLSQAPFVVGTLASHDGAERLLEQIRKYL